MKNSGIFIIVILGILLLAGSGLVIFLFPSILNPGCAVCGSDWVNVGRIAPVNNHTTVNLGEQVVSYDAGLVTANRIIPAVSMYSNCPFQIDDIYYYKQTQGNIYLMSIKSGSTNYNTVPGSGDLLYRCPSGKYMRLAVSPSTCNPTTNPSPADYSEYQSCKALGTIDIYIPSSEIQTITCRAGQTRTRSCSDGSSITQSCVNNTWEGSCPRVQQNNTCSNTCAVGYSQSAYPTCTCIPPQNQETRICTEGQFIQGTCPTGQSITTYTCQNGLYVATTNSCPVQQQNSDQQNIDYTAVLLVGGFVLLIVSSIIIGAWVVFGRRLR